MQAMVLHRIGTRDGGFKIAREAGVKTAPTPYPPARAKEAPDDLREGRLQGAAVLVTE